MNAGRRPAGDPCLVKALELLALRTHFRAELQRKLEQRGFAVDQIEAALDRLAADGTLDDRRAARELLESRLRRRPEGRRKLLAELRRRGAPGDVAAEAVAELTEGEEELAIAATGRWQARGGGSEAALARHLERRGFAPRAIVGALRQLAADDPVDG